MNIISQATRLLTASLLLTSSMSYADFLGFKVGAHYWQQTIDGEINSGLNGTDIDFKDDLGLNKQSSFTAYALFEHPVPVLPNVLLQYTNYNSDKNFTLERTISFDGKNYSLNESINSDVKLSFADLTLYYEIIDTDTVGIDVGLTVRALNAKASINSNAERSENDLNGALPLLYGAVKFNTPAKNLYVAADLNWLSFDKSSMIDFKAKLGYEILLGLSVELGYRSIQLEHDEKNDLIIDTSVSGPYAGLQYHF